MDLTQAELGAKLRVSDQTVARWEKGETPIPGRADGMLRIPFLASGGKALAHLIEDLDELHERDEPEHPAPIRLHHAKKWEPEKARRELEYA
jgi:transcriptional regulator with XRE-family HTH domain